MGSISKGVYGTMRCYSGSFRVKKTSVQSEHTPSLAQSVRTIGVEAFADS